jgi:Cu-Zn family superoxide dismutase
MDQPGGFMRRLDAALLIMTCECLLGWASAYAQVVVPMNRVDESGVTTSLGQISAADSTYGLVLTPALTGLTPGLHGFHVHEKPSCEAKEQNGKIDPAAAAGSHFDPQQTKRHGAPWGDGHLGDLPALYVDSNGSSTQPILAPRLKTTDLHGRSLMIHAGGDNHADHPAPVGGGGARIACGVVP